MKKIIFSLAAVAALTVTSCRKIESDGQIQVVVVNGGNNNNNTTGKTIELKGEITKNDTLRKANNYTLTGLVYVKNGATLVIEPGTTIKGSYAGTDVAALIITRGSKIMAEGTASEPIVFTSASPNPQSGDWGGIVLLGKASVNTSSKGISGLLEVEGGVNNANGDGLAGSGDAVAPTPVNDDNSGVLKYVRIEYAGYAFQPDKELNSLTMAAVGNKTTIENVQVSYAKDDAFEWFGGTVNCKYLIAYKTQDDDFDTDNGFSGKVQFGIVLRDPAIADVSKSEAFESDNDATSSSNGPKTTAVFSNITALGPLATGAATYNSLFRAAAHIRRNTEVSIVNSVIIGWPVAFEIEGDSTASNYKNGKILLTNNYIGANVDSIKLTNVAAAVYTLAQFATDYKVAANKNTIATTVPNNIFVTYPFTFNNFDPSPFGNAAIISGKLASGSNAAVAASSYAAAKLQDAYFDKTPLFIGAVAPGGALQTWWKGWTRFNF